jgi:conserved oligomeric Golgi complex subunit 4
MATDTADLDAVASVENVERILDELLLQEAEVDARLQNLLDPNNQPDLTSLTTLQHALEIDEQISLLNERIGPTAQTANGLSERVKKLDIEQARAKESLKYVEDVQELKVYSRVVYTDA